MRRVRALLAVSLACGCTTTIVPPAAPAAPASVFVVDYGRHASLLLPDPFEPGWIEYTFGDWRWFALDRSRSYDVFPTLFWPTSGTLGRCVLPIGSDAGDVRRHLASELLLEVVVPARAALELAARLHARFERDADDLHYQPLYGAHFLRTEKSFHLFHNCNHQVAAWLRELGCEVRGSAVLSSWRVAAPGG